MLHDEPDLLAVAADHRLATIANMPLAMGLLSGKYAAASRLSAQDVRGSGHSWVRYFSDGRPDPAFLAWLAAVREVLTGGGRTLAQGALGWLMARTATTIAIPGFKNLHQAEENAGALALGPLEPAAMRQIQALLAGPGLA